MILWGNELHITVASRFRILLLALAVPVAACDDRPETPVANDGLLEIRADMVGYDTQTYLTTNGIRSGEINSDSAFYYADSSVVHMRGVEMKLYTDQGAVRATLTSERGRFDERTQGMHAQGDVVLVLPGEERRVESEELYYDPRDKRIWSDSASIYTHEGRITRGTCIKSDLDFTNTTICNIRGSADVGAP